MEGRPWQIERFSKAKVYCNFVKSFAHPAQQCIVFYNRFLILRSADRCYLWVSFHHALLQSIIHKGNYRFGAKVGKVESHSPIREPQSRPHSLCSRRSRGSRGTESPPAGQTKTSARTFRMTLVAQGKLPQNKIKKYFFG